MMPRLTRRALLGGLAAALAGGAAYAGIFEPAFRLHVQRWALQPSRWPRGLRLRIAVIADPHVAPPYMPLTRLDEIVARTNALDADLIVCLGDYVAGHRFTSAAIAETEIARRLARLSAPLGVYAILGNHDWWEDPDAQARLAGPTRMHHALAAHGVRLLENDAVRLTIGGRPFWLAGMGDPIAFLPQKQRAPRRGVDDLGAALGQISDEAPAVLLLHEPDFFPAWRDRFALSLAGHTHGGQVRLFGWSPVVPSAHGNRFAWGPVEEEGHTMVVSGGLGTSILPIRFGMPPEITLVELS